jgi:selenide, water dikinase
VPKGQLF